MNTIAITIDRFSTIVGKATACLTLLMVLVTCGVVAARYLFNVGSIGFQESVMYMHGAVFMLGIAYTLRDDDHVRVDIVYEKLSHTSRAWIDLCCTVVFLFPVAAYIGISSIDYVALSWILGEGSAQPGGLPGVYLLKALIPVMAASLALQGVSEALKAILVIQGATTGTATDA
ncbi:MAG: TRAP transporter small permease subunit [Pseudomonadales bacterium]